MCAVALAKSFSVEKREISALLSSAGAKSKRIGDGIFMTYLYPDGTQYKAIRVKVGVAAAPNDDDNDDDDDAA